MSQFRALVIDDEPDIGELIAMTLSTMDIDTTLATSLPSAKHALAAQDFDLCLTDLRLGTDSGLDIIPLAQDKHIPIAVITAHGNIDAAIEAMKLGAFDFISKPIENDKLKPLVSSALQTAPEADKFSLIGSSPAIEQLRQTVKKVAHSQAPIYISGPSGSGKERVARLLHASSPRASHPFIPVNCGAIPSNLVESELFGYIKGSFTGAQQDKLGLFQAANQGTLFLDEVADLPLDMQVKLLRAIQDSAIRPIGSTKEISINVRILSASNLPLASLVEKGAFREDLYYRLNVIQIPVPSLQERPGDIEILAEHIVMRLSEQMSSPKHYCLTPEATKALKAYPFPGNVRELENILERAVTLCDNQVLTVNDLQLPTHLPQTTIALADCQDLDRTLQSIEKSLIQQALQASQHNITEAAKRLNVSFRSLRYRLDKLSLNDKNHE